MEVEKIAIEHKFQISYIPFNKLNIFERLIADFKNHEYTSSIGSHIWKTEYIAYGFYSKSATIIRYKEKDYFRFWGTRGESQRLPILTKIVFGIAGLITWGPILLILFRG